MPPMKPKVTDIDLSSVEWKKGMVGEPVDDPVEVAFVGENILMRNGGDTESPILVFTQAEWDAFVAGALDGEFDYGGR
ncbi:DUF397 domain-containing protein [Microbispora bryophytorum]|uniref:DUF397 domain-containing protein n=1 Tax=Microbispora bryophytorum TaxID=1460882 RepID=UPI0033E0A028